jgi:hypothetical protein
VFVYIQRWGEEKHKALQQKRPRVLQKQIIIIIEKLLVMALIQHLSYFEKRERKKT